MKTENQTRFSHRHLLFCCSVGFAVAVVLLPISTLLAQQEGATEASPVPADSAATDTAVSSEWIELDPTGARASFLMPKRPRYVERQFTPVEDQPPINVRLHIATIYDGKATFVFGYHDLHEAPKDRQEMKATLDGAVRGSVINVAGRLDDEVKILNKGEGRQFGYYFTDQRSGTEFAAVTRIFLVDRRLYQVTCSMERSIFDGHLCAKFLNSVRTRKYESDLPPRPPAKSPAN